MTDAEKLRQYEQYFEIKRIGSIIVISFFIALLITRGPELLNGNDTNDYLNEIIVDHNQIELNQHPIQNYEDEDIIEAEVSGQTVRLEVAKSAEKQQQGLMNITELEENSGMIFIYNSPTSLTFWMKNTLIPLDIIYLDQELNVINIHKNTKTDQTSEIYPSNRPAQYVIELNGGWSAQHNLNEGDEITFNL